MRDDLKTLFEQNEKYEELRYINITNNDLYRDTIKKIIQYHAYKDAQRTFVGVNHTHRDNALKYLCDELVELIQKPAVDQKEFNEWHKKTCNQFVEDFKGKATVGQAQKVINMALKYLYYYDFIDDNEVKFCHMTLDSYTLAWYKNKVRDQKRKDTVPDWSKLDDYDSKGDTGCSYAEIQGQISDYLANEEKNSLYREENGTVMTPFVAEFYIWPMEQLPVAEKALKKAEADCIKIRETCDTAKKLLAVSNQKI